MKIKFEKKYFAWGLTAFLVIAASLCFYYLLFHMSNISSAFKTFTSITMPVIDGLVLAYLMTPILNVIENHISKPVYEKIFKNSSKKKMKKRVRVVSIILTLLVVIGLLSIFFRIVIPQIIMSIQSIIFQMPLYFNNLYTWVLKLLKDNPEYEAIADSIYNQYSNTFTEFINNKIIPQINTLISTLSQHVFGVFRTLWNMIIGFIISIYVLGSKETFAGQAKKILYAAFETKTANKIVREFRFTHKTFIGFIGGKVVDSIIIGFLCFICTSIIGTPYSVLVSCIVGVTNIIPFFGPYIGAIPSILLVLMINPMQALYLLILILLIQQFDGNILGPKILGESTGLPGFWVIFSITLGGGLFGVLGMIVGVPIFAVIYAGIKKLTNSSLEKKNFPTDSKKYINLGQVEDGSFIQYHKPKTKSAFEILNPVSYFNKFKKNSSDLQESDETEADSFHE